MEICIFEDSLFSNLLPLAYTRPVYLLRCGMTSLEEKIRRAYQDASFSLHCRPYLAPLLKKERPGCSINAISGDRHLFINGRILADDGLAEKMSPQGEDCAFVAGGQLAGARLSGKNLEHMGKIMASGPLLADNLSHLPSVSIEAEMINYPWNLVSHNASQIAADFRHRRLTKGDLKFDGVHIINKEGVFIGNNAEIMPCCVIDASQGPVYIDEGTHICPHSFIEGPCYIGKGCKIKSGAKIYEGVSMGDVCKIGGEVEESIIQGYSNKQHEGFLGHAYLGQWVNLGAGTSNSDLKNNYGSVKVRIGGETVDSGQTFVGLFMGDHSKSAINTVFNTGTSAGVSCNIFGNGFPPKEIPSFCWGGSEGFVEYRLDKALETAKKAMKRRGVGLSLEEEGVLNYIMEATGPERRELLAK